MTPSLNNFFFMSRQGSSTKCPLNKVLCRVSILVLALTSIGPVSWGQELRPKLPNELTTMSLEDLMNIEVTSVSKKEEKLFKTAAAIFVITQEDIRRSGITSIPELLRLVPGLSVARIDGNKWAVLAHTRGNKQAAARVLGVDRKTLDRMIKRHNLSFGTEPHLPSRAA